MVLAGNFDIFQVVSKSVKNQLIKTAGLRKFEVLVEIKKSFAHLRKLRIYHNILYLPQEHKTSLYLSTALTELSAHAIITSLTG